jgi:hypothetical protein
MKPYNPACFGEILKVFFTGFLFLASLLHHIVTYKPVVRKQAMFTTVEIGDAMISIWSASMLYKKDRKSS